MESNKVILQDVVTNSENTEELNSSRPKGTRRLRKKNYEKINDDIRKKIIFEVTVLGNKLKTICEKLNINVSSAKNVLAIYKKEGRIEKKKYRVKRRKTGEDQEISPDTSTGSSSKQMNSNVSSSNINPTAPPCKISSSIPNTAPEASVNDVNISLLFENYCMCPQTPQMSQLMNLCSMPSIEDYFLWA